MHTADMLTKCQKLFDVLVNVLDIGGAHGRSPDVDCGYIRELGDRGARFRRGGTDAGRSRAAVSIIKGVQIPGYGQAGATLTVTP